jgi:hypothetical protein
MLPNPIFWETKVLEMPVKLAFLDSHPPIFQTDRLDASANAPILTRNVANRRRSKGGCKESFGNPAAVHSLFGGVNRGSAGGS